MAGKKILIIVFGTLLTGCGLTPVQKQQVAQFASATETVATATQDQLKTTREKVIELERRRLIMRNDVPPPSLDLDGGLSATGIATQIATLKALQSYGDVLNKLATNDQGEAIAKAATTFMTQFEAARKTQDSTYSLEEDKKNAALGVIGITTSWFIEKEKKKHIKTIVNAYAQDIGQLAELLKHDLTLVEDSLCIEESQRKPRTGNTGVIDIYCTSADAVKELAGDFLREENHSFSEREFAYNAYALAQQAKDEIGVMSNQGAQVVAKLAAANQQLHSAISTTKYTTNDIRAFARQVEELKNHIDVLNGNQE